MSTSKRCFLYRIFAADGALLYVGIARDLARRFRQHWERRAPWHDDFARSEVTTYKNRHRAEQAERVAVLNEKPRFNKAIAAGRRRCARCGYSLRSCTCTAASAAALRS